MRLTGLLFLDSQKKHPENSTSLYDWLDWIYAKSNEAQPDSFVFWQLVEFALVHVWEADSLTIYFTIDSPKLHVESIYNVMDWYRILQLLPRQVQRRNEIYRQALVYVLSQLPSWQILDTIAGDIASAKELEQRKDRLKLLTAGVTERSVAVSY